MFVRVGEIERGELEMGNNEEGERLNVWVDREEEQEMNRNAGIMLNHKILTHLHRRCGVGRRI